MALKRLQRLCLWLTLTTAGTATGQGLDPGDGEASLAQNASLPVWVVPVLRLVSSTHVEPTTGIVLSESGLVLVPADFAGIGDEVIVLDGGTDIIRNGRPARIEKTFAAAGLEVLKVEGLRRPAASLPTKAEKDGDEVTLAAFPPAEQIAEGQPPLSVPAALTVFRETGKPALSRETPLPNVTGPLVDACGDLVGVSLANDIQTMDPSPATRYAWTENLADVFAQMQIRPAPSRCPEDQAADVPEAEPPESEDDSGQAAAEEPAAGEPDGEETRVAEEAAPEESLEPPAAETLDIDILPPIEKDSGEAGAQDEATRGRSWLWLLAAALLFGGGAILHRLRRAPPVERLDEAADEAMSPLPESVESDESDALLQTASLDHFVLLEGVLADGSEFETRCPVSERAINVTIGRGGADLVIDSPAVSRRHASLNGSRAELTLTDLGSSNGTSINGVPVLEDEIMYLEPGDTIVLGNVRCRFEIRPRTAEREDDD